MSSKTVARPPRARRTRGTDARRSPETVEKRRAARAFNELLLGPRTSRDGRSERRRRRLLRELEAHARGESRLKPVDVLSRVDALLELETSLEAIEGALPPPPLVPLTPELAQRLHALHRAYGFREASYRFVGVEGRAVLGGGVRKAERASSKRGAA